MSERPNECFDQSANNTPSSNKHIIYNRALHKEADYVQISSLLKQVRHRVTAVVHHVSVV